MFPHKPISVLSILTVILVLLLCSPWSAMAQIPERRLIPVVPIFGTETHTQSLLTKMIVATNPGNDDEPRML